MSLMGRIAFGVTERLRKSDGLNVYRAIQRAPSLSREDALAHQFELLSRLLRHAEEKVPYYRELFRDLGITSRDIRSLDDFARLPVLTKDIIRERHADLIRRDLRKQDLIEHHSGGSTGVPLTFFSERSYMDASAAGTYRSFAQAGWRPGDMVGFFWGWNDKLARMSRLEFEFRQYLRRTYQFSAFESGPEQMEQWIRTWRRVRPKIALGYASTIARFAEHIERSGNSVAPLSGVFSTAEKLFPQQRELMERVFSCKVYDSYGSSEVRNIATECRHGRMHVNVDFVVVEEDRSVRMEGQPTPLLVTSLRNYAMPFIRYRNEDCGELVEGSCECGSGFPLMSLNVSRITDNFRLPNGRVAHGLFFIYTLYGSEGIQTFQFHQTTPDQITLRIVPQRGMEAQKNRAVASAVEKIRALAPGQLQVDVEEVDSIPLTAAGKHRYTRTDVALI